jgi:polyphosphate kinase
MWLSSADWMNRNMMRRVEIAWPIIDAKNRARILQECCQVYLDDNQDAWLLQADGSYKLAAELALSKAPVFSAQQYLMQKYAD